MFGWFKRTKKIRKIGSEYLNATKSVIINSTIPGDEKILPSHASPSERVSLLLFLTGYFSVRIDVDFEEINIPQKERDLMFNSLIEFVFEEMEFDNSVKNMLSKILSETMGLILAVISNSGKLNATKIADCAIIFIKSNVLTLGGKVLVDYDDPAIVEGIHARMDRMIKYHEEYCRNYVDEIGLIAAS